jgi:hypothetical protein
MSGFKSARSPERLGNDAQLGMRRNKNTADDYIDSRDDDNQRFEAETKSEVQ